MFKLLTLLTLGLAVGVGASLDAPTAASVETFGPTTRTDSLDNGTFAVSTTTASATPGSCCSASDLMASHSCGGEAACCQSGLCVDCGEGCCVDGVCLTGCCDEAVASVCTGEGCCAAAACCDGGSCDDCGDVCCVDGVCLTGCCTDSSTVATAAGGCCGDAAADPLAEALAFVSVTSATSACCEGGTCDDCSELCCVGDVCLTGCCD